MNSIAILQARTTSSRLPGKVLLPINGIPLAVLAAKRAANRGHKVIVATSLETSDDGLAELIRSYELKCFRGNLENTLNRFVSALAEYNDQTIVFRLTADNVFPDGELLEEIEQEFCNRKLEYLCCNGEQSGLPYGMSVEITRLAHLREAALNSTCIYDQEHVTPYIIRKFGATFFQKYKALGKGHFRCTIDCLDEYLAIQQVFANVNDPIHEPSLGLVNRLDKTFFQPIADFATPKLVLGTAQMGLNYGIANTSAKPSKEQCKDIIKTAIANGVVYLDTANAYGDSESMIGQALDGGWRKRVKIISKLSPLQDCPKDASISIVHAFVNASIYKSCSTLKMQKIDVLMLHRVAHLSEWYGAVWHRLLELQSEGVIVELGASVQSPQELEKVLEFPNISYIQMPFNLLDWRWDSSIQKILSSKAKRNLTIHVRSSLLQGLLSSTNNEYWFQANVDQSSSVRDWLLNQTKACHRANIIDLCLSYVNSFKWIDGITIGVDNISQLIENINYLNLPPLSKQQVENITKERPSLGENTLNPTFWRKTYS